MRKGVATTAKTLITLTVRAKPGSKKSELVADGIEGEFVAFIKSPPEDGKANKELQGLIAAHYGVRVDAVDVKTTKGRTKIVTVEKAAE